MRMQKAQTKTQCIVFLLPSERTEKHEKHVRKAVPLGNHRVGCKCTTTLAKQPDTAEGTNTRITEKGEAYKIMK